ncbi:hypothetical protein [Polaribacter sp. SA4-12]|uniref:hypothetical protein n=1 Tax=Polaribacter sp. SA4-12 TaxID=1312072 RepID=UPI0012F8E72A|nr:hypothetical protein [Polaribacter sp. SA4-12]
MKFKDLYITARNELSDLVQLENSDFRLEQAEYNKKGKYWEIVVSYLIENTNEPINSLASFAVQFKHKRMYKTMKIKDSGEVLGFYIYDNE